MFVEGAVIVASIMLAFGVDAWWQERQEGAKEQAVLVALRSELLDARQAFESQLGLLRKT